MTKTPQWIKKLGGHAGELYVAAELSKRGIPNALLPENFSDNDILIGNKKGTLLMEPDNKFLTPDTWTSSLNKLSSAALGFTTQVATITKTVDRIAASSNTISAMTSQLSVVDASLSSVSTHVEDFRAIISSPSSLLVDDSKSKFLSAGIVVDSIASTLSSAASMADTFRSATEQLFITDHGKIEGLHPNNLAALEISKPSITLESLSQKTLPILGNRLETDISTFNNLMDISMATS
ncbi:hypothetical protein HN511_02465, partial [bacterium]|nr:hypothetical protein [bacterium]